MLIYQFSWKSQAFFLAGGQGRGEGGRRFSFGNVFQAFDDEFLAEAYDVPVEIVRNLKRDDRRGFIVNVHERMRVMVPEEQEEEVYFEGEGRRRSRPGSRYGYGSSNGFEETFCTMRIRHNTETRRESDFFSRQAGRVNIVNQHKLPILGWMDMSLERGNLLPVIYNSMYRKPDTIHYTVSIIMWC